MGRKNRRPVTKDENESQSHWMSYADLMSGLLLMFALFLMVNIYEHRVEVEAKDKMIENVIGVRTQIIEDLQRTFSKSSLAMEVDPHTGAIRFADGVFFDYDSDEVSKEGIENLKEFIPIYIGILLSDQYKDHISEIIVEGHTDDSGTYLYNLELSQNRAFHVVKEIFNEKFPKFEYQEDLKYRITSNGRSYSMPIYNEDGKIDEGKSRRVEFKFRLKDDQLINEIEQLLSK